jgi:hypothetical protein
VLRAARCVLNPRGGSRTQRAGGLAGVSLAILLCAACDTGGGAADSAQAGSTNRDTGRGDTTAVSIDDCVRGEPEPALSAGRGRFERTGKLEAIEETRLDDSTSLRIRHTGCAHYVQHFELTVRGVVRDTADARYWLARGAEYLEALPAVETLQPQLNDMRAALRSAADAPTSYSYGDPLRASEMAHVYFTVRSAGRGAVVVEIVFDYVL